MRRQFATALVLSFTLTLGVFFLNRNDRTHASSAARLTEINVQPFKASQLTGDFDAPAAWKSIATNLKNQGVPQQAVQKIVRVARRAGADPNSTPAFKDEFRPVFVKRGWVGWKAVWMMQLVAPAFDPAEGRCLSGLSDAEIRKVKEECWHRMLLFDAQSPHENIFVADYVR